MYEIKNGNLEGLCLAFYLSHEEEWFFAVSHFSEHEKVSNFLTVIIFPGVRGSGKVQHCLKIPSDEGGDFA